MGEWQTGDEGWHPRHGKGTVYGNDLMYFGSGSGINPSRSGRIVRIPRTIDDSSLEAQKRSLWGMVDWTRWRLETWYSGQVRLYDDTHDGTCDFARHSITEAILRALCAQEGVEV